MPKKKYTPIQQYSINKDFQINKYQLENGLKVVLWRDKNIKVFSHQIWYDVGSSNEVPGKTGLAHLFEHLMFKESKNLKHGEFDRIIEENGGNNNASTWNDWTSYQTNLCEGKIDLIAYLEAERMKNLILNDIQVETEKSVVINEREYRIENNVDGRMMELLSNNAYSKHPYKCDTIGYMDDIKSITLDDCISFYNQYYSPNNATIIIVGGFDEEATLESIDKYYSIFEPSIIPKEEFPVEPKQLQEKEIIIYENIPSTKILMGYHVPRQSDSDFCVFYLLNVILTDGESARFYKNLVVKNEIACDVSGFLTPFKYPGLYILSADIHADASYNDAIALINEELEKLYTTISEKDLEKARNIALVYYYQSMEEIEGRAHKIGHWEVTENNFSLAFKFPDKFKSVCVEDIRRVLKEYLIPSNRTKVIALPKENGK